MTFLKRITYILFFFGISLQIIKIISKTDFRYIKEIGVALIVISILLFIISQVKSRQSKNEIAEIHQTLDEYREQLEELKHLVVNNLELNPSLLGTKTSNGIGYNLLLTLYKDTNYKNKYIIDEGESISKNRFSIFLDNNNNLNFRVIDQFNKQYRIKIKKNLRTFEFNKLFYLICEYGNNGDSSFIRIIINGNLVANKKIKSQINTEDILGLNNRIVGANLNHIENASFGLAELIVRNRTWTSDEVDIMVDYFDKKVLKGVVSFLEDDFMYVDKQTNSLVQPIGKHQPKTIDTGK